MAMGIMLIAALTLWAAFFVVSPRVQRLADYQIGTMVLLFMTALILLIAGRL